MNPSGENERAEAGLKEDGADFVDGHNEEIDALPKGQYEDTPFRRHAVGQGERRRAGTRKHKTKGAPALPPATQPVQEAATKQVPAEPIVPDEQPVVPPSAEPL